MKGGKQEEREYVGTENDTDGNGRKGRDRTTINCEEEEDERTRRGSLKRKRRGR